MLREEIIEENIFTRIRIPKPDSKVIETFTEAQITALLTAPATGTYQGYRDYVIMLVFLDTGIRLAELRGLRVTDVDFDNRLIKVLGKGNRERQVPFGTQVQREFWKWLRHHRPKPATPKIDKVFLTGSGRPLTEDNVQTRIRKYGENAGIQGVRCSPHTFRHTFAVRFLRDGGDLFSLQRILGHRSLDMVRRYANLSLEDIQRAHQAHSPVDNLPLKERSRGREGNGSRKEN